MRVSPTLIDYLKRREDFRATQYLDAAGKLTIGYGHLIRPHEKQTLVRLTEPQAEALLVSDVAPIELYLRAISPRFEAALSQHQFDGLVSLAYNIGLRAFEESTLLKRVRADEFEAAAAEFDRWIYITVADSTGARRKRISRGLVNRRRMDRAIFERGVYAN